MDKKEAQEIAEKKMREYDFNTISLAGVKNNKYYFSVSHREMDNNGNTTVAATGKPTYIVVDKNGNSDFFIDSDLRLDF